MKMDTNFKAMSLSGMADAYNAMISENTAYMSLSDSPLAKFKPIGKFKDKTIGLARCEALSKALSDHNAEVAANVTPEVIRGPAAKSAKSAKPYDASVRKIVAVSTMLKKDAKPFGKFDVRPGSNREKLLLKLLKSEGKQVSLNELLIAVYGSPDHGMRGPMLMVMKGLFSLIETDNIPYKIEKQKNGKEISFGINKTD